MRPFSSSSWLRLTLIALVPAFSVSVAHAQDQVLPVGGLTYNAADCGSTQADEVQFDTEGLSGSYFWSLQLTEPQPATGTDCPRFGDAAPAHIVVPFADAELAALGRFQHLASYTPADLMGPACSTTRRRENFPLCIYFSQTTATPQSQLDIDATSLALTVAVDTIVPSTPTVGVSETNGGLRIIASEPDDSLGDTYTYEVQFRACDDLSSSDAGTTVADGGTVSDSESLCDAPGSYAVREFSSHDMLLSGLVVDEEYEVRVTVIDDFGNRSGTSAAALGTPRSELGPLDLYDGEDNLLSVPGPDVQSCNESIRDGSFGLLGLGLWGLARRRRARRRERSRRTGPKRGASGVALLTLLVSLFALPAAAYPGQVTLGFKAGPYTPAIDTELAGGSRIYPIYKCFFEQAGLFPNGILPNPAIDVDVHLFDQFGSLELGMGMSFTQAQGKAVPVGAIGASEISTRTCPSETGTQGVELTIIMAKPQLTYRLDQLNDYFGIPFVPYARLGLVSALYAFTENGAFDNDGVAAGRNPLGVRFGAEASVGMMFALDWLDLRNVWDTIQFAMNARNLTLEKLLAKSRKRTNKYLDHTYVFAELSSSQINTFGMPGLVLSPRDNVFGTGLPWTFQVGMAAELF